MKNRIGIIGIVLTFMLFGCSKDNESTQELIELPEISVIDISQESEWDYWVVGKEDYFFINKGLNNLPESILFHSKQANKDYSIFLDNNGNIDKVVVDDFIFVFRNFNNHYVDVGLISPAGEINIYRNIETSYNWDTLNFNKPTNSNKTNQWSDVVRWTGRVVAGVPCAISVVAAVHTAGVLAPAAAWTCGNYLVGLASDIAQTEGNIHNGLTSYVGYTGLQSTVSSCGQSISGGSDPLISCLSGVASTGLSIWADHLEEMENIRDEEVHLTESALENGYGDVQITLVWDDGADLDLHVIDPNGEEIYYMNRTSESGGMLDIDDIDGEGPENIFWQPNQAPSGNYQVYVHDYTDNGHGTSYYTVLINAFGQSEIYTGSITNEQLIHIKDFNENGHFNKGINKSIKITTAKFK